MSIVDIAVGDVVVVAAAAAAVVVVAVAAAALVVGGRGGTVGDVVFGTSLQSTALCSLLPHRKHRPDDAVSTS